jgi:TetR/AcrR family tetracycline transcriptional repressor
MADAIVSQARAGLRSPGPGQPWWEWLAEVARGERAALLAHRDSALVISGHRPFRRTFPAVEQEARALVAAGLTPPEAVLTLRAVGAYVAGEVLGTQGEADQRFEFGLALIIAGLRARLADRAASG